MKRILLIEDDHTVRENTAELLELSNYEVTTASDGKKGICLAKDLIPDLIICDIMMPEVDGYGVLKDLSHEPVTAAIPFIFLTARTEHKDIRKGMDLGADDYLTKPFEEEDLLSAIESRLAKVAILQKSEPPNAKGDNKELQELDDLRTLFKNYELQHFNKGESIYEKGTASRYFYLIKKGVVKVHQLDKDAKELITDLYKADDFFGNPIQGQELGNQDYATAMQDTQLYAVPLGELEEILTHNPKITLELIKELNEDMTVLKQHLMDMAYGSVRKKAAKTILLFAENIEKHPLKSIRISRADLASVAGMAQESLIRTLSDFKKEGLIRIEGRNIELVDPNALKAVH